MKILMGINISSLMNMGTPKQINAVPKSSISSVFYATQDIKRRGRKFLRTMVFMKLDLILLAWANNVDSMQ